MFEFLKRKKKEKFVPRIFKFYGEDARTLWRLYDISIEANTMRSRNALWNAINKRISDHYRLDTFYM